MRFYINENALIFVNTEFWTKWLKRLLKVKSATEFQRNNSKLTNFANDLNREKWKIQLHTFHFFGHFQILVILQYNIFYTGFSSKSCNPEQSILPQYRTTYSYRDAVMKKRKNIILPSDSAMKTLFMGDFNNVLER